MKTEPTTREELEKLKKPELEALSTKRGIAVSRADGEEGEPLVSDYVEALATAAQPGSAFRWGRYVNAEGHPVNEDGDRIDSQGQIIEESK